MLFGPHSDSTINMSTALTPTLSAFDRLRGLLHQVFATPHRNLASLLRWAFGCHFRRAAPEARPDLFHLSPETNLQLQSIYTLGSSSPAVANMTVLSKTF